MDIIGMPGTTHMGHVIVDGEENRMMHNWNSWFCKQSETKAEIDDIICRYVDGDTLKHALIFIGFVRESKMKIKRSSVNVWAVKYKRKHVLDIIISQNSWGVHLVLDHIKADKLFTPRKIEEVKCLINLIKNPCTEPKDSCLIKS